MVNKKNKYYIGVDIGGTNLKAVLFDGVKVVQDSSLATPKDNLDHFFIMIQALVEPLMERAKENKARIEGIGLSVAGVVDVNECKVLRGSPNLFLLNNVKLGEKIKEKIGLPVKMDNDGNCFLLAEHKIGAAKDYHNVYGITLGTGIGGAWIFDDKIYYGSSFGANEPARMIVDLGKEIDIEMVYQKLTQGSPASMAAEAYKGDVLAEKSFQEMGYSLGIVLANIVNLIDPEAIVIGGGVMESGDLFIGETKKAIKKFVMNPESKKVKILKSRLGDNAGAIGAALLFN